MLYDQASNTMVTPVTDPDVMLSRVLRACLCRIFTGVTAQILTFPSLG